MKKEYINVKLSTLTDDDRNEKVHTEDNLRLIRESMELGYVDSIVVDENHKIMSGHGRKTILLEADDEPKEVMMITGWSEAEKEKYRIFANQSARTGYMDNAMVLDTVNRISVGDPEFNAGVLSIDGLVASLSTAVININVNSKAFDKAPGGDKPRTIILIGAMSEIEAIRKTLPDTIQQIAP